MVYLYFFLLFIHFFKFEKKKKKKKNIFHFFSGACNHRIGPDHTGSEVITGSDLNYFY